MNNLINSVKDTDIVSLSQIGFSVTKIINGFTA